MKKLKNLKLFTLSLLIVSLVIGVAFTVQPVDAQKNAKIILDDATGGDCVSIGKWDSTTKTCTMTDDSTEEIRIYSDGITLDGNGHTIQGSGHGIGVYLSEVTGIMVKNLNLKHFEIGIYLYSSSGNAITGNTANENKKYGIYLYSSSGNAITGNTANENYWYGIYLDYLSDKNILTNNTANENQNFGIYIHTSNNNDLTRNVANSNRQHGIYLFASSNNNILTNNVVYSNRYGIYLFASSNNNILTNNIVANNYYGIYLQTSTINALESNIIIENDNVGMILLNSNNNEVYKNNFIDNPTQILLRSGDGNVFNLAAPIGGNYWSNYDANTTGCNDANSDGFCDSSFVFKGGQDNLPWQRDAWGH